MKSINFNILIVLLCVLILPSACKKQEAPAPINPPIPQIPVVPKNCIISGITQMNTGSKSDFILSISFNANNDPVKFIVYDSMVNVKIFEANLSYITADSIRIDQYQYIKLDALKRVSEFVTKSDMATPSIADDYRFIYSYNNEGYLSTKNLYINGSSIPSQTTTYTYTNNLLTKCIMVVTTNASVKLMEAELLYDHTTTLKNWIYTFPDAFETNIFNTALSFGNKSDKALLSIITSIYNPVNGKVIDTWTTNYGSYQFSSDGYLQSFNASGDLQQGIISCFGKTSFIYNCK